MRSWLPALAFLAAAAACDTLAAFRVPLEESFRIEGHPGRGAELPVTEIELPGISGASLHEAFRENGVEPERVASVRLHQLTLSVVEPAEGTLGFLDFVRIRVEAPERERLTVASAVEIPSEAREISLRVEEVELQPWVVHPEMRVVVEFAGERPLATTVLVTRALLDVETTASESLRGEGDGQ